MLALVLDAVVSIAALGWAGGLLVLGAIVALLYSVRQADHEHADRLSLLPLEEDEKPSPSDAPEGPAREVD